MQIKKLVIFVLKRLELINHENNFYLFWTFDDKSANFIYLMTEKLIGDIIIRKFRKTWLFFLKYLLLKFQGLFKYWIYLNDDSNIEKSLKISKKELEIAKNANYQEISLGKRILRSETACIFILSILSLYLDD